MKWRINVLVLIGSGFFTIMVIFSLMVWKGSCTPSSAYEVIESPLMALIGGSVAVAKDVLNLDREESTPTPEPTNEKSNA